jgi:hypothetical protein
MGCGSLVFISCVNYMRPIGLDVLRRPAYVASHYRVLSGDILEHSHLAEASTLSTAFECYLSTRRAPGTD